MNRQLSEINIAKFILILGVVLIHCNFVDGSGITGLGADTVRLVSANICGACVPGFFIISGFLFFRSMSQWDTHGYVHKLRRRVSTLLVPYLLWNLVGSLLFIVKARWLGYPAYGILTDNGAFDILAYLRGYCGIGPENFPYDFPLWFLRNLIIFNLLAPAVYIIGRHRWLLVALVCIAIFADINTHFIEYYAIGAWIGIKPQRYQLLSDRRILIASGVLLATAVTILQLSHPGEYLTGIVCLTRNLAALPIVLYISAHTGTRLTAIAASTFFIYAMHGLYSTLVRSTLIRVIGAGSTPRVLLIYLLTFMALTLSTYLLYRLSILIAPRLTRLLTGGRQ